MDQGSALGKWLQWASWAGWVRAGEEKPGKKQQKAANGKRRLEQQDQPLLKVRVQQAQCGM